MTHDAVRRALELNSPTPLERHLSSPLLSVDQVAYILQVTSGTVRRWIRAGKLAAYRTTPKRGVLRIPAEELDAFLVRGATDRGSDEAEGEGR